MTHLFLSYSRRNQTQVREIRMRLQNAGVDTFFDDCNLRAGHPWPQALEQALQDSIGVAVFVGSEIGSWQWAEIGFALDRQTAESDFPVIPILLDGAETTRSLLFLNSWLDMRGELCRDDAVLHRLVEAIANPRSQQPPDTKVDLNPYRGLEYFDEAHASFFFGREKTIAELFRRLIECRTSFIAVIGASGSGKSSVVRAGLIPRLRRQRPPKEAWDIAVIVPGERPWFRLADALAPLRFPEKIDSDLDIEVDKLSRAIEAGELQPSSLVDRILRKQGPFDQLLLVVDQFEELFTVTPFEQRQPFIDALLSVQQTPRIAIVLTLRADFYGQAIECNRTLSDLLSREQITLGRLDTEELRRTISEPAKKSNLAFDPGLLDLLLLDAGNEPGNLPLLQHTLSQLFERRQGRQLTADAYKQIGGIRRAIANTAETEYAKLDGSKKDVARLLFTKLVRLAHADEGLEDTRRRVPISFFPPAALAVMDEFSSARLRLLVKSRGRMLRDEEAGRAVSEHETVEVAHEALIREWGRLRAWLNEDRGFYLWRQRLDQFIVEYQGHGEEKDYLLSNAPLREAEARMKTPAPEALSTLQIKYIEESVVERDKEIALRSALEREAREAREERQIEQMRLAQTQREHADQERERALAQSFVDRRRSIVAILTGAASFAAVFIWMWFSKNA